MEVSARIVNTDAVTVLSARKIVMSSSQSRTAGGFSHEKLVVYQRALRFFSSIDPIVAQWDSKHAIQNHLPRAAESIVENTAAASGAHSGLKQVALDYALGSALESAACLDIAGAKQLMSSQSTLAFKQDLVEVFKMLVGLRRSWSGYNVRDKALRYEAENSRTSGIIVFHHERLDVYQVGMAFIRSFSEATEAQKMQIEPFRKLDCLATAILLNIAEGNGRFSIRDHRRFLKTAHQSAIKLAAQLDLCQLRRTLRSHSLAEWKCLLSRIASMTKVMIG